ncbi:MAG: hypothetical protein D6738_14925, partial [Acidobacteria bacterium]
MTDPVVIRATTDAFPGFVDNGVPAGAIEVWVYRNGSWQIAPFQIDELSAGPKDYKDIPADARECATAYSEDDIPDNLCEFHYDLRRTGDPSGTFSTNDELVLLAGSAGDCGASTSNWPSDDLDQIRYRIMIGDNGEYGCFYVLRRTSGTRPAVPDLITYDESGDGVSHAGGCHPFVGANNTPTPEACGAIVAPPADIDGNGSPDTPGWRWDYLGNWTVDKWFVGETGTADLSQDLVDLIKWRIAAPAETEGLWDFRDGTGKGCTTFHGFIDGPVRVVRVIGGAASGAATTKYEFAYPDRVLVRVNLRVHDVDGPIYSYPDLMETNVSPGADNDPSTPCESCAVTYEQAADGSSYSTIDEVDGLVGSNPAPSYAYLAPYQVSSDKGSFLFFPGEWRIADTTDTGSAYNDQETNLWTDSLIAPEYHEEAGDKGAARSLLSNVCDTQNRDQCLADRAGYGADLDPSLTVIEYNYAMISSGKASPGAGGELLEDQARGVFSTAIREEMRYGSTPSTPSSPCVPSLNVQYDNDGGEIDFGVGVSGCGGVVAWNLYRAEGLGRYRRLSSLPIGSSFELTDLALNESQTYYATTVGPDGLESAMTQGISVLHNDIVAPLAPTNLATEVTG